MNDNVFEPFLEEIIFLNISLNQNKISNRAIGKGNKPFIIAEMSGKHNKSLETALKIIDCARIV